MTKNTPYSSVISVGASTSPKSQLSPKDVSPMGASKAQLAIWFFVGALVLAFGFEVFSFNMTIDEELLVDAGRLARADWGVMEGRWGMAALTLLLPNPVVPTVSTGLGIALSGFAWWTLSRRFLGMGPWAAALAGALAGTIPTLAFIMSFSTVAFGIGAGNLLLVAFAAGITSKSWAKRSGAVFAAAAAASIYDTFLIAIVALCLALIFVRPRLAFAGLSLGAVIAGFALSRIISTIVVFIAGAPSLSYVVGFIDISGLIAEPWPRLVEGFTITRRIFFVAPESFGLSSPVLGILIVMMACTAIVFAFKNNGNALERLIRIGVVLTLIIIPFGVGLIAPTIPLRSMIHLPILILALSSVAYIAWCEYSPRLSIRVHSLARWSLISVLILSILGNATVINRLFVTAATTYAIDQNLAFAIGQEKDKLMGGDGSVDMPAVVSSLYDWPDGALTTRDETIGVSFMSWNATRGLAFLRAHGVLVHPASPEQAVKAWDEQFKEMPVYPSPGWVAEEDGVLLLNFGGERPPL